MKKEKTCKWEYIKLPWYEMNKYYLSKCGKTIVKDCSISIPGIEANTYKLKDDYKYCPYCGRKIEEVKE